MAPVEGPFDAPNPLEAALMNTASDWADQPSFIHLLVNSKVYVIGWRAGTEDEPADSWNPQVFKPGDHVAIPGVVCPDGTTILPFYSSLRWLSACIDRELKTLTMGTRDLLDLTAGETLFLNYGTPWGREFPPKEVANLVEQGAVGRRSPLCWSRELLLGVREPEPIAVTAGVASILASHERITAAYLGTVMYVDDGKPPHLVIGLEGKGDIRAIRKEVGTTAGALAGEGVVVDVIQIEPGGGTISDFLVVKGLRFYGR
ncbi:MAG: enhanced serine sensitivity protein SseB C-terminal domain-containing protein [Demequinaceae bacterium]|nr:enhanced serine sensitivity protein SseB C-terminal domain-containing protein [Demequinaceae bacterium]